ncbi:MULTISPECIES: TrmH family RNA methyltransferase [Brucella/Ochrobactrum group]|uniref:tRNA/rRNA methyltransferase (SpoU) n=1 Tax=Brucella anthropi (strain ATCC 49188 / DSM 6882 / CCUG 24695 / JCM 21032 / LMG 3331 / NBRC 15819 / NCTC 12168 / Alc 37) TaxID=439375 RepID=A6WZ91_BRUA4|nr:MULTISPECIES: RNA methyltransferase [Brucella/Ochrobactrum group]ABS14295.1 tRNA/rRNA methyltransferase (SpoU) [Brucella anthropi ATCC 49188]AIK44919.1 spoU rRNA Methylase family protein [Brucella anthropi]KAB2731803.1 RNA methyltransferase [Brucella anthropi]KAB2753321.1 RNA methyltransferase [Brucella anthropi]KAB2761072.1 RNA methyltransferase [Brucella anthropi]
MNQDTHSHGCVQQIDDPNDIRLSPYRDIREKDLVGRQQRFIAEGKVVLNVLFSSSARFETESLLVLENRLAGLGEQLSQLPSEVPVYSVPQTVMDAVAGFHVHRGILAVGRRKTPPSLQAMLDTLPAKSLVVVLCGISNHDNVGSIFRNAAAFEADCVLMDDTCCDPLYRKAIRVSVGATLKVPYFHGGSIDEIIAALGDADFNLLALSPSSSLSVYDATKHGRQALLLGTEGEGLPPRLLEKLQTARIPMSTAFDSLNVATASGIALSRFSKFQ